MGLRHAKILWVCSGCGFRTVVSARSIEIFGQLRCENFCRSSCDGDIIKNSGNITTPQWKETNYKHVDEIAIAATAKRRNVLEFLVVLDSFPCHVWVCGVRVACWDCSRASAALCDPHRHHPQPPSSHHRRLSPRPPPPHHHYHHHQTSWEAGLPLASVRSHFDPQRHARTTVGHLPKAFRASVKIFISYTCAELRICMFCCHFALRISGTSTIVTPLFNKSVLIIHHTSSYI